MSPVDIRARHYGHLKRLVKQGYITRTGSKKDNNGNAIYIYEVVKNE